MTVEAGGFRTDLAGRSLVQPETPIADYVETAGKRRKEHRAGHGMQPGYPARAAAALIDALRAANSQQRRSVLPANRRARSTANRRARHVSDVSRQDQIPRKRSAFQRLRRTNLLTGLVGSRTPGDCRQCG